MKIGRIENLNFDPGSIPRPNEKETYSLRHGDDSLIRRGDIYKAIDDFIKLWNGEIVDPIQIRALVRQLPAIGVSTQQYHLTQAEQDTMRNASANSVNLVVQAVQQEPVGEVYLEFNTDTGGYNTYTNLFVDLPDKTKLYTASGNQLLAEIQAADTKLLDDLQKLCDLESGEKENVRETLRTTIDEALGKTKEASNG